MEEEIRSISAEEFAKLNFNEVTLLDLREPDEVLVHEIEGAINVPFSRIGTDLDKVPKDKTVYVFCRVGDWSEEVTEILTDRGYDAVNLIGGFKAYKEHLEQNGSDALVKAQPNDEHSSRNEKDNDVNSEHSSLNGNRDIVNSGAVVDKSKAVYIDAKGMKCPGPVVKVADTIRNLQDGRQVHVEATEDAFASDIAVWCSRTGNKLINLEVKDGLIEAWIEKQEKPAAVTHGVELPNDKTFVVFSGDLDKTIAAFIMANGAAAMGRQVTIFFTFWGLNILRKPKRVRVKKTFIENMFGFMMPRGTLKLGLSRMNMGGLGAKMIRAIMKSKNVNSLEELIQSALEHGVRLVACQMSMDIMGIKQEELIEGVELGGVATFLGSGELSDMSLFI
ncbi:MAG: DsrE/DsrF/DrsH-like family protein [Lachnospiraceae bacterium]|nr:DsrE/DsrF/DrsH-like family protein [Lachnospiraceae bacterium]